MRTCAIIDESLPGKPVLGYLFCYQNGQGFSIEISENIPEEQLPLFLASFVQKGMYTVGLEWSLRWVQARIVPTDRQNLGSVLKDNGLKEYNEYRLLMIARGRCAQDDCCVMPVELTDLPSWVYERLAKRVKRAVLLQNDRLLVSFEDSSVRLIPVRKVIDDSRLITDEDMQVQPGGCGIAFFGSQSAASAELHEEGELLSLRDEDLLKLSDQLLLDTNEVCRLLACSRQQVDYLIRTGRLHPLRSSGRMRLFDRSEVQHLSW